jgi:hypothetical protein
MMGGVEIETRLPGETKRDARRRAKRERKELENGQRQRQLPAGRRDD